MTRKHRQLHATAAKHKSDRDAAIFTTNNLKKKTASRRRMIRVSVFLYPSASHEMRRKRDRKREIRVPPEYTLSLLLHAICHREPGSHGTARLETEPGEGDSSIIPAYRTTINSPGGGGISEKLRPGTRSRSRTFTLLQLRLSNRLDRTRERRLPLWTERCVAASGGARPLSPPPLSVSLALAERAHILCLPPPSRAELVERAAGGDLHSLRHCSPDGTFACTTFRRVSMTPESERDFVFTFRSDIECECRLIYKIEKNIYIYITKIVYTFIFLIILRYYKYIYDKSAHKIFSFNIFNLCVPLFQLY